MGEKEGMVFRNNYKGHMDKTKWVGWGWLGWWGVEMGKWRQPYLNNNTKIFKKEFYALYLGLWFVLR